MRHPNFILGVLSLLILLIGIGVKANGLRSGDMIIIGSVVMGAIHWIWSIIDVFKNQPTESQSKKLWMIIVILIPPLGGILYYAMSKTVRM